MSITLAMGIPTTPDDRGYLLWLGEHWTVFVLPTLIFGAVLVNLFVKTVRAWTARPPSTPGEPGSEPGHIPRESTPNYDKGYTLPELLFGAC